MLKPLSYRASIENWHDDRTLEALKQIEAGQIIPGEKVLAFLKTWGVQSKRISGRKRNGEKKSFQKN